MTRRRCCSSGRPSWPNRPDRSTDLTTFSSANSYDGVAGVEPRAPAFGNRRVRQGRRPTMGRTSARRAPGHRRDGSPPYARRRHPTHAAGAPDRPAGRRRSHQQGRGDAALPVAGTVDAPLRGVFAKLGITSRRGSRPCSRSRPDRPAHGAMMTWMSNT